MSLKNTIKKYESGFEKILAIAEERIFRNENLNLQLVFDLFSFTENTIPVYLKDYNVFNDLHVIFNREKDRRFNNAYEDLRSKIVYELSKYIFKEIIDQQINFYFFCNLIKLILDSIDAEESIIQVSSLKEGKVFNNLFGIYGSVFIIETKLSCFLFGFVLID